MLDNKTILKHTIYSLTPVYSIVIILFGSRYLQTGFSITYLLICLTILIIGLFFTFLNMRSKFKKSKFIIGKIVNFDKTTPIFILPKIYYKYLINDELIEKSIPVNKFFIKKISLEDEIQIYYNEAKKKENFVVIKNKLLY